MTWDVICHILAPYGPLATHQEGFARCERLLLLDEAAEDHAGAVYVTDQAPAGRHFAQALIVSSVPWPETANHITAPSGSAVALFNALARSKTMLDELDSKLALCRSDQEMVDVASAHLGLPMFYLGTNYRILAITRDFDPQGDPEWHHMTQKGFLSPESARAMKENGELDLLEDTYAPVSYHSKLYPFPSVVCNIRRNGLFIGRLNLLCVGTEPSPFHERATAIIAEHLARLPDRENTPSAGDPLQSMLVDLLRGVRLSQEFINERLRAVPWKLGPLLQLFYVDIGVTDDRQIASYYDSLVQRVFPSEPLTTLLYEGQLLLLAWGEREEDFGALHEALARFCTVHGLGCGASNPFRKLSALRDHREQAVTALALGGGVGVHFYRDRMLDHLISYLPRDREELFISPDIIRLQEAEKDFSFSLVDTLQAYLACNCNLIHAAERLFLHKNTLLYRMNHIRAIIRCDLNDADERLLLMLSFKLLERKK